MIIHRLSSQNPYGFFVVVVVLLFLSSRIPSFHSFMQYVSGVSLSSNWFGSRKTQVFGYRLEHSRQNRRCDGEGAHIYTHFTAPLSMLRCTPNPEINLRKSVRKIFEFWKCLVVRPQCTVMNVKYPQVSQHRVRWMIGGAGVTGTEWRRVRVADGILTSFRSSFMLDIGWVLTSSRATNRISNGLNRECFLFFSFEASVPLEHGKKAAVPSVVLYAMRSRDNYPTVESMWRVNVVEMGLHSLINVAFR